MPPDQELVLIFGVLHLIALVFVGLLFLMFFRSEPADAWRPPPAAEGDDGGGGGHGPQHPPTPPPGGGSATPAKVRLRDHRRLSDRQPVPPRRPAHGPRPTPTRTGSR